MAKRLSRASAATGVALMVTLPLPALGTGAVGSSLKLKSPSRVKYGARFDAIASGFAAAPANKLVAFGPVPVSGVAECLGTYKQEIKKYPDGVVALPPLKPNHKFSRTIKLQGAVVGTGRVCAYVINVSTLRTYAHAAATFSVHR